MKSRPKLTPERIKALNKAFRLGKAPDFPKSRKAQTLTIYHADGSVVTVPVGPSWPGF